MVMRQNYKFDKRILDKESDLRYVDKGKLVSAVNCRTTDEGVVKNLEGTLELNTVLPSGHTCIGAKKHDDWIYYFSTNNTISNIGRYNVSTDTNEALNISNSELNLKIASPIDFINFLDDSENGKLLMFWTDGLNSPRYYDWNNPPAFTFDESFFSVIKAPPFYEPKIRPLINSNENYIDLYDNYIEDVMLRFAYRYIYKGGQVSSLSNYSKTGFYHDNSLSPDSQDISTLRNYFNFIEVELNVSVPYSSSTFDIEVIEVFAIDLNSDTAYKIKTIDHDGIQTSYKFDFDNSGNYQILSSEEANQLYDNTPIVSNSQTIAEDRLFYGRYSDGYNNNIAEDWNVSMIERSVDAEPIATSTQDAVGVESILNIDVGAINNDESVLLAVKTSGQVSTVITLLARKNYASINALCADPDNRIDEIFESKNLSVDTGTSDRIIITANTTERIDVYKYEIGVNISLKKGETYDYAICYFDKYNRPGRLVEKTGIVSANAGTAPGIVGRKAFIEINHTPPVWAEKFLFYRKEKKFNYQRIDKPGVNSFWIEDVFSDPDFPDYNAGTTYIEGEYMAYINGASPSLKYQKKSIYISEGEMLAGTTPEDSGTKWKYFDPYEVWIKIPEEENVNITDESKFISILSTYGEYGFSPASRDLEYRFETIEISRIEVTNEDVPRLGVGRWIVIPHAFSAYDSISYASETVSNFEPLGGAYSDSTFMISPTPNPQDEAYKEVPGVYPITGGYHALYPDHNPAGSARDQSEFQSFRAYLAVDGDIFYGTINSFSFAMYDTESNNIYSQLGRPQIPSDLRFLDRKFSVTYSGEYNYETGFNGLSSFNTALINFKDYPREYGPIKSLYYRDTDIVVFQENKVIRQPYNKNIIESIGGGQALTSGGGVLGVFTAYNGEYGMSNPESLAFRGYALFWVDTKRGVIMRLSQDGLFPISNFGMKEFFRELLISQQGQRMQGYHDWFSEEYAVHIPTQGAWHFNMAAQGWTHVKEFTPDRILNDGLNVYSFKGLSIYKHNELTSGEYNIFYGSRLPLSFEVSLNEAFSDVKTLHSLFIEGDKGAIAITDQIGNVANIPISFFENKEGNWHSYIPMNSTTPDSSNLIGLGVITNSVDQGGGVYTLSLDHNFKTPQLSDVIKSDSNDAVFVSRTDNDIVVSGATGDMLGEFIFIERLNSVSGDNMRGNYFTFKYEYDEDGNPIKVFAINIEANKSNV